MSEINLNTPQPITKNANKPKGVTVNTASAIVSDTEPKKVPKDSVDIEVGVFFDGTNNNRNNVNTKGVHKGDSDSYYYDLSNIARLEPAYNGDGNENDKLIQFGIYIEGIGTEDGQEDDIFGYAAGTGDTGILEKVKKACIELAKQIAGRAKGKKICQLTVDTFGFSRGAAAARNFIHEISKSKEEGSDTEDISYGKLGEQLKSNEIEIGSLSIRFTGLYDTVASYGSLSHKNDTKQLHLDAVAKSLHVLQLAADDEHRANFRLTNIDSAVKKGVGVEKFLPGVHADIGGGYTKNTQESHMLDYAYKGTVKAFKKPVVYPFFASSAESAMEKEQKFLMREGWYGEGELLITDEHISYPGKFLDLPIKALRAKRTVVSNQYTYIPLHLMAKYAMNKQVTFNTEELDYKIEGDFLTAINARLEDYVLNKGEKLSFDNAEDRETVKDLRNQYLHFSAYYGPDKYYINFIDPHKPEDGRKRIIKEG